MSDLAFLVSRLRSLILRACDRTPSVDRFVDRVDRRRYGPAMATGHVEPLKNGFRAKVYVGTHPITKQEIRLRGPVCAEEEDVIADLAHLLHEAKSRRFPDPSATVARLLDKWMEIADHEPSPTPRPSARSCRCDRCAPRPRPDPDWPRRHRAVGGAAV